MTRSIDLCLSVCSQTTGNTGLDCTALHGAFGYCPARARSLPEFPHYFLNAPKLNARLIPFLITASCQRRTTTTTTKTTTPTTPRPRPKTKNNTHHHLSIVSHRSRSSVLVPTRPQNQTSQTSFFSLSVSVVVSSLCLPSSSSSLLVCFNFSWLWTDFIIAGFFQQLLCVRC